MTDDRMPTPTAHLDGDKVGAILTDTCYICHGYYICYVSPTHDVILTATK